MTTEPAEGDRVSALDDATWALTAVITTQRDAATTSLAQALAADPVRTAVLVAACLVHQDGDELTPGPALRDGPAAASLASARLSSLRQALDVAAATEPSAGWADRPDDVLLDQGHASAATGRALATRLVPTLTGLADRLAVPGSRVLDIGCGVAALSLAVARELPAVRVTGIDVLERAIRLARRELAAAGAEAERVDVRNQDVVDLDESDVYDLVWLPAPFLSPAALAAALPRVVDALVPGGWLVAGTNPLPSGGLAAAVAQWNAERNGGSATDARTMSAELRELGLGGIEERPTVPGGPVLVIARKPVGG